MKNAKYQKLTLVLVGGLVLLAAFLSLNRKYFIKELNFQQFARIDFTLGEFQSGPYSLATMTSGRPTVLFFWSVDCPVCKGDLGFLNEVRNNPQYSSVEISAVSIGETPRSLAQFFGPMAAEERPTFKVLMDSDRQVATNYEVFKTPETFLINKEGMVFKRYLGPLSEQKAEFLFELAKMAKN
ncbi:MAG: TlpA disulfide reductase family protein [Pseudomonadota bacterium]